jgi:hypothetical protein
MQKYFAETMPVRSSLALNLEKLDANQEFKMPNKLWETSRAPTASQMFSPDEQRGRNLSPIDEKRQGAQSARGNLKTMKERFQSSQIKKQQATPVQPAPTIYERSLNFSTLLCPYCSRKFSEKAGSRHIVHCKEKAELKKYKEGTPKTKTSKPSSNPSNIISDVTS